MGDTMDWKSLDRIERVTRADEIAKALTKTGSLGERIKIVRIIYGMKQADFAEHIGVSRSYLSESENEKGKPSIEMVVGIAQGFLYLNTHWLLTGEGSVHVPIEYDDAGFSILPDQHIDSGALLAIFVLLEEKFGDGWIGRQKGARRKSGIISYFYDIFVSAFKAAEKKRNLTRRQCREKAKNECLIILSEIDEIGLPSVRHKTQEL